MDEFVPGERDAFRSIDRRTWKKYLFYVDMLVWGIFGVAMAFLLANMYVAGWAEGQRDTPAMTDAWWNALVSLSFMVGAIAWLFFRFWKNGYLALKKPF
jgi:hypothetical protein